MFQGLLQKLLKGPYSIWWDPFFILLFGIAYQFHYTITTDGSLSDFYPLLWFPFLPIISFIIGALAGKLISLSKFKNKIFFAIFFIMGYYSLAFCSPNVYWLVIIWTGFSFVFNLKLFNLNYSVLEIAVINAPYFIIAIVSEITGGGVNLLFVGTQFTASCLAIGFAFIVSSLKSKVKLLSTILISLALPSFFVIVYSNINYKNKLGDSRSTDIYEALFLYEGDTITLQEFAGKALVLDFWHTRCKGCFDKFPEFERLAERFAGRDDILFFSANVPLRVDKEGEARKKIEELGYNFKHLFLLEESDRYFFKFHFFPSIVYIDHSHYNFQFGSIETNPLVRDNSFAIIERLLKNMD